MLSEEAFTNEDHDEGDDGVVADDEEEEEDELLERVGRGDADRM